MSEHETTARNAEVLALDAERRAEESSDQDERDRWLRIAAQWWDRTYERDS